MASPSRLRAVRHNPELGRGRGKKAEKLIDGEYLDWELDNFSGYIAADELYDRPYCVLSIVDNRMFKQIERKIGYMFSASIRPAPPHRRRARNASTDQTKPVITAQAP